MIAVFAISTQKARTRTLCGQYVYFQARSQNREKRPIASSCMSVCLYVRIKQLGSHWMDFDYILYFWLFTKSVEKTHV